MMKRKKRVRFKNKRGLLNLVLVTVMSVSLLILAIFFIRYLVDRASYAEARSLAVSTPVPNVASTPMTTGNLSAESATSVPLETPPITVDFETVRQEGSHVRAWLYNEGTAINYPVVYYSNNEYYLTHDYTGKRNQAGTLFFDTAVGKALTADNLIVYGHHMKDGSMFRHLMDYQKQSYYDAHPVMYLLTLDGNFRVELFAGRFMDSDSKNYPVWFASEQEKKAFVNTAIANSDFVAEDREYHENLRLMTMVTCAYSSYIDNAKYQVLGWLVPIG